MPIARALFALLLMGMAVGQLLSFSAFVDAIASYRIAGEAVSRAVALALLASEIFAGAGLLTGWPRFRLFAGAVGSGVAVTWAALAVQAFFRRLDVANCGCFGSYFAQRLSWLVLLQDVYFVVLAYLATRSAYGDRHIGRRVAGAPTTETGG